MGKIDHRTLTKDGYQKIEKELSAMLKEFGMRADGISFMLQLLTKSEVVMAGRRIQIAHRLLTGQSFPRIAKDLTVGVSTIRNVHNWLEERIGQYRLALPPILEDKPISGFSMLRKTYPAHFMLINMLLGDPFKQKQKRKELSISDR